MFILPCGLISGGLFHAKTFGYIISDGYQEMFQALNGVNEVSQRFLQMNFFCQTDTPGTESVQ